MRKINKTTARRLYNDGEIITLYPNKVRPDNPWIFGLDIEKALHGDFDSMIDMFSLYNCNNNETGTRVAFYYS